MEVVQIGQSLIIGLGLIILIYIAGKQVLLGIYDISDFVLINGYILQFATPLSHMGFIARNIRRGINELTGVIEIYSIKRVVPLNYYYSNSQPLKKLESIEFKNVSFGYNSSHLILKNISFHLELGKTIGIVGATGSGKSTLSNLLFNFYEAQSGSILINNKNIQDVQSESLCKLFGIVPQDLMLFNATIYENILFARPDASKEEVEQVIELVQLGSFIKKLPNHYNTMVGERGLNLSGGEKQRIAIARVLLKQPSLYIFDEATSSLDILTEETIMKKIAPIIKNSAVLIVAHRLSTVVNADEILVLNNGVVEEQGTHVFLLKKGGFYASMWRNHEKNYKDSNVE
jgi:ABC-type transport system involved in Fe-S cluster assembly fused permease/ATPase subunit